MANATASTPTTRRPGATETAGAILFLHAQTSLHPGSGTALGTVDLPVQRERHTHWPLIPGSALKGVLREAFRRDVQRRTGDDARAADADLLLTTVFGPPSGDKEELRTGSGAVTISDARLLAFPVRSLRGVFAWATCPAVVERLARDLALVGYTAQAVQSAVATLAVADGKCLVADNSPLLCAESGEKSVVLEEFDFGRSGDVPESIVKVVADALPEAETWKPTRERVKRNLVVLSDDDFTHFARYATEVSARIGLEYSTKTVKPGALFYQEFLPPETIFYAPVLAAGSRRGGAESAADILTALEQRVPKILQVGGDESTGKGFCATRLVRTEGRE